MGSVFYVLPVFLRGAPAAGYPVKPIHWIVTFGRANDPPHSQRIGESRPAWASSRRVTGEEPAETRCRVKAIGDGRLHRNDRAAALRPSMPS